MNNLVFNTTASELKTAIYAQSGSNLQLLQLDGSNNLMVAGTVTVSQITDPVTIGNATLTVAGDVTISNATLTVAGTVTVSQITNPVTIGNATLTVAGDVTISNATLTVAGTVTVSQITNPVTIGNATLTVAGDVTISNATLTVAGDVTISNATLTVAGTVTIGASTFTADSVTSTSVTGTGVIFPDKDISALKVASIFIYNEGATPVTISLQISPTTTAAQYINDSSYTNQVILASSSLYMDVAKFAHYIRLQYNLGALTATFSAYFNAQA